MFVVKNHRRTGVGKGLLRTIIQIAWKNLDLVSLELTTDSLNTAAIGLYTGYGFSVSKEELISEQKQPKKLITYELQIPITDL